MTIKEVSVSLCYYDKRNPDCCTDAEAIEDHKKDLEEGKMCYCDNCYYGRTRLAEELLKYIKE